LASMTTSASLSPWTGCSRASIACWQTETPVLGWPSLAWDWG
jgi:hypothetical protein